MHRQTERRVMDIIYLNGLEVETVIGIYDWERQMPQTVVIDLEMGCDIGETAANDQIDDTINYKAVTQRIIAFAETNNFKLVETLAERIANILRDEFGVPWLRLRINKRGAVKHVRDVGVVIERGNRD